MNGKVFATQCPMMKQGNQLIPKWKLGPTDLDGRRLRDRYGELIWVCSPTAAPWSPGVFDAMRKVLSEYNGDRDYLLLLGNPVLMAMTAVLASEFTDRLQFLQWSNNDYMPVKVEL